MRRVKRREFLSGLVVAAGASATAARSKAMPEQSPGTAAAKPVEGGGDVLQANYPKVLVNHIGFRPEAGKYLLTHGVKGADSFGLINTREGKGLRQFTRASSGRSAAIWGNIRSGISPTSSNLAVIEL